jgi:predicted peroxiredoxin
MASRVVVGCTHGEEDPDHVIVAYLTAVAALEAGKEVVMWCTVEGVRLGLQGYADGIRADMDPPVARVHSQFVEKGGQFYICPVCFSERDLDDSQLIEQAELKGATPLMEFVGDGATTFTY